MNSSPDSGSASSESVLVVSADESFRQQMASGLRGLSWQAEEARGGAEALFKVRDEEALLLDVWIPDLEVTELIQTIKAKHPTVDVWLVDSRTGEMILPQHPPESHPLRELLQSRWPAPAYEDRAGARRSAGAPAVAVEPLPNMVGTAASMAQMYRLVRLVAPRETSVLLLGETGTGKELVARAIHQLSARAARQFVVVNCAAIPEALLEAELFGFTRGAFTGAVQSRLGHIHAAHEGTLFLDEIGEIAPSIQAKLLRFLEEGEVQRLGSPDVFRVNVRVITATNADLAKNVREGRFRKDLYYRLAVFPIELPPLRVRRADILALAEHFLTLECNRAQVPLKRLSSAAQRLLESYAWPGNIRELEHAIERAFILAEASKWLEPEHFSQTFGEPSAQS